MLHTLRKVKVYIQNNRFRIYKKIFVFKEWPDVSRSDQTQVDFNLAYMSYCPPLPPTFMTNISTQIIQRYIYMYKVIFYV